MILQEISTFLKDWVPPIGVIGGGVWVFYCWIQSEKLRKEKERSSLNGELTYTHTKISENTCIAIFTATWTNRSPLPIAVQTENTGMDVYIVDSNINVGGMRI
ncbi:MAG: hypothetical protein ACYC3G_04860, partial [Minisyncoccota bacterium]